MNSNKKRAGIAIRVIEKIDFKSKTVSRDKDGHYMLIQGSIYQKAITIMKVHSPNTKVTKI